MKKIVIVALTVLFILLAGGCSSDISLEEFTVYLDPDASPWERNAAHTLADAVEESCGVRLEVVLSEDKRSEHEILIGKEILPEKARELFDYSAMGYDGFGIATLDGDYMISAVTEVGIEEAVKYFVSECVENKMLSEEYFYLSKSQSVRGDSSKKLNVSIEEDSGYDVYKVHESVPSGYRYGPSMIVNDDGSIDLWLAGGGSGIEQWDWIVYMHSDDGVEWTEERCVLQPTPNGLDHYSCCDPGVIYVNGYYYLGYTATANENQCDNNLFVARSKNPDGPYEKWNGSGWGGDDPKPIVFFSEDQSYWGTGEVSFVELDGTLYIYYTMNGAEGHTTRVATADADDENWPLNMEYRGIALGKGTNDAIDVKYMDEYNKFIAVASEERLTAESYLMFYESNDGLSFEPVSAVKENVYYFCHNPGISGTPDGHIKADTRTLVAYAYGKGWGVWNTRIQDIKITLSDSTDFEEINGLNIRKPIQRDTRDPNLLKFVGISTGNKCVMSFPSTQITIIPTLVACDITHGHWVDLNNYRNDVTVSVADESVVKRAGSSIIALNVVGVGETMVTFEYKGLRTQLYVIIYDGAVKNDIVKVEPMAYDKIAVSTEDIIQHQIKPIITYGDGHWESAWSKSEYDISYEYDSSALTIDETSHIIPKKAGMHEVVIKVGGCSSVLTVDVKTPEMSKMVFGDDSVLKYFRQTNNCDIRIEDGKLKCTATKAEAPFFVLDYTPALVGAENYKALTIRYMIPSENAASKYQSQIFLRCNAADYTEATSVRRELQKDGVYHDMTIDLSKLDYWNGDLTDIRIDFFDSCDLGDKFYIEYIELK